MSLGSKYDDINEFYTLLNAFINHNWNKFIKIKLLNNINKLYNKYFDAYKKDFDSEKLKDEEKKDVTLNKFK